MINLLGTERKLLGQERHRHSPLTKRANVLIPSCAISSRRGAFLLLNRAKRLFIRLHGYIVLIMLILGTILGRVLEIMNNLVNALLGHAILSCNSGQPLSLQEACQNIVITKHWNCGSGHGHILVCWSKKNGLNGLKGGNSFGIGQGMP